MAKNYFDATGVLVLGKVTPVIKALFGPFNLDESEPGNGEVYIAKIAENNGATWDDVLDGLNDLVSALQLAPPQTSGEALDAATTIEDFLYLLAAHFKVDQDEELGNLIEQYSFEDDADLNILFMIAQRFDDGHGLKAIKWEGCWHSDKPRLFEFGGNGLFIGKHYEHDDYSSRVVHLGNDLDEALEAGDLDKGADRLLTEINRLLNGVAQQNVREALRTRISQRLV